VLRLGCEFQEMFAFPCLEKIFTTIAEKSNFKLHCSRAVKGVVRGPQGVIVEDANGLKETFDDIVFACNAETVLKALEKPSW
jgi:predicted NAD/FAD-binding protein